MKAEAGKLTCHIPILLKGKPVTNAYDALKEIPGVIEQNEQITLLGTRGLTILLNGQKLSMTCTQLMALLRTIPLPRVEDVGIMCAAAGAKKPLPALPLCRMAQGQERRTSLARSKPFLFAESKSDMNRKRNK